MFLLQYISQYQYTFLQPLKFDTEVTNTMYIILVQNPQLVLCKRFTQREVRESSIRTRSAHGRP